MFFSYELLKFVKSKYILIVIDKSFLIMHFYINTELVLEINSFQMKLDSRSAVFVCICFFDSEVFFKKGRKGKSVFTLK